jgi:putative peptidoglycan lipid II flippase
VSSAHPTERIARPATLAGAATLISRILGLVRETVLAAVFGAGNDMDAFNVAFRIPNLMRDLFAEGAMSAAFVPAFARKLALDGTDEAWRLGNHVLNALAVVTCLVVAAGWIWATPLVTAYAGSYAQVPGKLELTIRLARVMLPFLTLVAIAAALMGMLNASRHYFIPSVSPAAFNVITIASTILLAPLMPRMGLPPIMALAIGTLAGGVGQVGVQWPSLAREGFRYAPLLNPRDPGLREVLLLMGPGTIGLAATQINLFVNTLLATGQGTGAVSWLQYAFRLMYLPIGLFGVSIATAVLPAVSRQMAVNNPGSATGTIRRALALMLLVNVPATVGLWVLATPIVQLLLERGHFQHTDTLATAAAVRCYAIGLVGYSASRIASPVFYALGRSRVPVLLSAVSVAANLTLSVWLVTTNGFLGLALATSAAALLNGGLSLLILRQAIGGLGEGYLIRTLIRIAGASAVMGVAVTAMVGLSAAMVEGSGFMAQATRLGLSIGAGLAVLALSARMAGVPELN